MIIYKSRDIKKFSANGHVAEAQNIRLSSTKEVTWMHIYELECVDFHVHFLYLLNQNHGVITSATKLAGALLP